MVSVQNRASAVDRSAVEPSSPAGGSLASEFDARLPDRGELLKLCGLAELSVDEALRRVKSEVLQGSSLAADGMPSVWARPERPPKGPADREAGSAAEKSTGSRELEVIDSPEDLQARPLARVVGADSKLRRARAGEHWHRGIRYASRGEAACGDLLERFLSGYRAEVHRTFQVPVYDRDVGTTKMFDFFAAGHFIEYHPPRFWRQGDRYGDFQNAAEYFKFKRELAHCESPEAKREYKERVKRRLTERYAGQREKIIAGDPHHQGKPLLVVTTAGELYDKVIRPFGQNYPERQEFIRLFDSIVREVKRNDENPVRRDQQKNFPRH